MCTVRDIEEAIREHCQSQHDMESTEIDQVMQRLPFGTAQDICTRPPVPKPPYSRRSRNLSHLTAAVSLKIAAFFMP